MGNFKGRFAGFFSILFIALMLNSSIAFAEANAADTSGLPAPGTGTTGTGTTGTGTGGATGTGTGAAGTDAGTGTTGTGDAAKNAEFACKNPSTYPQETVLLPQEVAALNRA
ncbi:MAG: hypothetical protein PHH08_05145, partial [Candidatus ainarchaeum sp.]|nr:hypothetical protein [Candidatus ainarchaeum sp.]